nr:cache domain-containing protein [Thaumasiovibrio subtropicus]
MLIAGINRISIRWKVVLLSIVPLMLVSMLSFVIVFKQASELAEDEVNILRTSVIESKKRELVQYIELALASIRPIYDKASVDDELAQKEVKAILHQMIYGEDGYFFVYTWDGTSLVLPYQPDVIGQNLWDVEDINGTKLLQDLIHVGRNGGGFVNYHWHKPSRETPVHKISYAVSLDKWQWMLGTGVYVDDIENEIAQIYFQFNERIKKAAVLLCVILLVAISLIASFGATINISERRVADDKLKLLNRRIIESQESERERVSRDLHDGINQILASVKYRLEMALCSSRLEEMQTVVQHAQVNIDNAINEVRRISRDLRPVTLNDLGLIAALDSLVEEVRHRSELEITFEHDIDAVQLSKETELALYRVAQEALLNIEKHAFASAVDMIIQQEADLLLMTVADDGIGLAGFTAQTRQTGSGLGLRNMRERIENLGGAVQIRAYAGEGTEIRLSLPLARLQERATKRKPA